MGRAGHRRRGRRRRADHVVAGNLAAVLLAARPSHASRARRALALLLATTATVTLAACAGQQASQTDELTGDQGQVQDVVQKLADRAERDDASGICRDLLAAELKTALGGAACAAKVEAAIKAADYTGLDVASVAVDSAGTTAVAQIKPVEATDQRRSITVTRAAKTGPWLIAALDPSGKTKLPGTTPSATTPTKTTPAGTTPKR